jgi:hypothetical protein
MEDVAKQAAIITATNSVATKYLQGKANKTMLPIARPKRSQQLAPNFFS